MICRRTVFQSRLTERFYVPNFLIDPQYDEYRRHIDMLRRDGKGWEAVAAGGGASADLDRKLVSAAELLNWPSLGTSAAARRRVWLDIVQAKRRAAELAETADDTIVTIGPEETETQIRVPGDDRSTWQLYKNHLLGQHWKDTAVTNIETSSLKILRRLRRNTQGQAPVRGLVVGHVQSGKTASMAGLMAMAADHGYNMFIVLSGTLENLRNQTKNRLLRDLNHNGNLHWHMVDHPSDDGQRAQDLRFDPGHAARYFTVCLKNARRLEALVGWVTAHRQSLDQMKILIIDDEADQGGVNTARLSDRERTRINKLIIKLTKVKACSVNYVAYTATPAANFLNEGPGKGLYPQDFIVCLPQSEEHFGPVQIFGLPEAGKDGLGIVRTIGKKDMDAMEELHEDDDMPLPGSLKEAVIWFLCCAAAMRAAGFARPVTMLIHTSHRQEHHENVHGAVEAFLSGVRRQFGRFLTRSKKVWEDVRADLDRKTFSRRFPDYGRLDRVGDYPAFEDIVDDLRELVSEISSIRLNDDGTRLQYGRGTHLCVDNCANNGVNDENEVRRLFYPEAGAPGSPDFATAFIVIGGSTLARGLTLENLVSSYFFRASSQADSLMQMGRWFGYRKGYELLPRIWMPEQTRKKFEFMTMAEEDLREDLKNFMEYGRDPSEYGPRVRVHPRASWLRPTAANRMQEHEGAAYDFSGVNRQTTIFHAGSDAKAVHTHNLAHTESFLRRLGGSKARSGHRHSVVWDAVRFAEIRKFLSGFTFHESAQFFSDLTPFLEWYGEHEGNAGFGAWNVVVAGTEPDPKRIWKVPGGAVGRVTRTRLASRSTEGGAVSVGALRDPRDLLADSRAKQIPNDPPANAVMTRLRGEGKVGEVPQLLLYLIDSRSKPVKADTGREPLGAAAHIVGISIWLPASGKRSGQYATHLTVKMPAELAQEEDDLAGTAG